jgi:hypothetical protein
MEIAILQPSGRFAYQSFQLYPLQIPNYIESGSMTKLTFFHQKRKDRAVRTGIEMDGELLLERYFPGEAEKDPALLWYVDVRCSSLQPIAADPGEARRFFLNIGAQVQSALLETAEELRAGMDSEIWPHRKEIHHLPQGAAGEVVCSAMKRITDGELAQVLRDLARNWKDKLEELAERAAVAHA